MGHEKLFCMIPSLYIPQPLLAQFKVFQSCLLRVLLPEDRNTRVMDVLIIVFRPFYCCYVLFRVVNVL